MARDRPGTPYRCRQLLAVLALMLGCAAVAQQADEYSVKAALVFNFAKFVSWPPDAFAAADEPIVFCVCGGGGEEAAFVGLAGREVRDRRVAVQALAAAEPSSACHVLFVAASSGREWDAEAARRAAERHTLTVSDRPDFVPGGGVIRILIVDGRLRFEIDREAAELAGLVISSRLLELAQTVHARRTRGGP